jgi:hypothetical protein
MLVDDVIVIQFDEPVQGFVVGQPSDVSTVLGVLDQELADDAMLSTPSGLSNTFEGGTNGATVTVGNSGVASGDAFSAVSIGAHSSFVYSAAHAAHGGMGARVTTPASPREAAYAQWTGLGGLTEAWASLYLWIPAYVADGFGWRSIMFEASGGGDLASVVVRGNGKVDFRNASGQVVSNSSTSRLPRCRWVRLQARAVQHPTNGIIEARWFTDPEVTVYGNAFGGLETHLTLPTAEDVRTVTPSGFNCLPGAMLGWADVTSEGWVVFGNPYLTSNIFKPSKTDCSVSVFYPETQRFENIRIPTSKGYHDVADPGNGIVGGATTDDVSVLKPGSQGDEEWVVIHSDSPYHGWRISTYGDFPVIVTLKNMGGEMAYDPGHSWTASQLQASSPAGLTAFPNATNSFGETYANLGGLSEHDPIPCSRTLVFTRYFSDPGRRSGHIVAIDVATGTVLADYQWPGDPPTGKSAAPRNIEVYPTPVRSGVYEFAVIYDVFLTSGGNDSVFCFQLFEWDTVAQTITPVSAPVIPNTTNKIGSLVYDSDGNLWMTSGGVAAFSAGPTFVYARTGGHLKPSQAPYSPGANWWSDQFEQVCAPDYSISPPSGVNLSWGHPVQDPVTKGVLIQASNYQVWAIVPSGSGAFMTFTVLPRIDLGVNTYIGNDPTTPGTLTLDVGGVDPVRRKFWFGVHQGESSATCASWPCPPYTLGQWLYAVDLDPYLGPSVASVPNLPAWGTGADADTPFETSQATGVNTGSNPIDRLRVGCATGILSVDAWLDDPQFSAEAYPPAPARAAALGQVMDVQA